LEIHFRAWRRSSQNKPEIGIFRVLDQASEYAQKSNPILIPIIVAYVKYVALARLNPNSGRKVRRQS